VNSSQKIRNSVEFQSPVILKPHRIEFFEKQAISCADAQSTLNQQLTGDLKNGTTKLAQYPSAGCLPAPQ
jgi:hypothetical protein